MKKAISFFMVLLLLVPTVLCGCKDGTASGTGNENSGSKICYGGKITVGITQDLDSLDPHKAVAAGTKEVLYNIFEGLVKVDEDGNLVPAVAASYEISADGTVYTFELRDNVRFHNGKTVTADDVIYSLKRVAGMLETSDPEVSVVSAFSSVSQINKTEKGVEVVLSQPNTELISFFTSSIIPCDYDNQAQQPVGTGPFKFVSYSPLEKIVVTKNEDYYIDGVPYLDEVTFKISASADAAFLELVSGSIDLFPYLTSDQAAQLEGRCNIMSGTMNLVQALFLNNAAAPFDDVRVRQAVCYAIDRQQVIDIVAAGEGTVIGTGMFPTFTRYYNSDTDHVYDRNTDRAKELLAEAGYPDGFSFTISVPSNYDFHVRTAQVLVEQLKEVGIKAEIRLVEWSTWLSDIYVGRDFEATVIGLDAKLAPSDVLRFYPSASSKNFINYSNAEVDALIEQALNTSDDAAKADSYKKAEALITADAASAFIQSPAQMAAISKKLAGYRFYPVYVQDMSTVYFTEEP